MGSIKRRTKIVATIGPVSREPAVLEALIDAGMDVARLNFSHGSLTQHAETIRRIRKAEKAAGRRVAVLQDLPGPKLRIGTLSDDFVELTRGDTLTFQCGSTKEGNAKQMSIVHGGLAQGLQQGETIYLADGAVRLVVNSIDASRDCFECEVIHGGRVASRQGVNIPGPTEHLPAVPDEDLRLLGAGEEMGVDLVALSFVRKPEDIQTVRKHTRLPLIAKIEKPQALEHAQEIIKVSDCVMIARGDLGIETPIEEVPVVQKRLLKLAGQFARPSITATQMLDSMVSSNRPTRAEVNDVANAILDGADAVMLSQETAIGAYPVESVAMMAAIAKNAETIAPYEYWNTQRVIRDERDPGYTIAYNACQAARDLNLAAIIVPTLSGRSVRLVCAHRPTVPIYALSPGKETIRRCSLMWGVQADWMQRRDITEDVIADAARRVVELGWCKPGERVAITAGLPSGKPGTTSLLQVQAV